MLECGADGDRNMEFHHGMRALDWQITEHYCGASDEREVTGDAGMTRSTPLNLFCEAFGIGKTGVGE